MTSKKYPKVLVISHNAFSKTLNNGKTYASIFSGWPKEQLAQLYFQNEAPDFSACTSYFKITDEDIILRKKVSVGGKVNSENSHTIKKVNSTVHNFVRKQPMPIFNFLRDVLWSTGKWKNNKLNDWINEISPEVIFFVGGGSSFAYQITNHIAKSYKLPIYLYYTDDYITPIRTIDVFWWLSWLRLRRSLKVCLKQVEKVFVIGNDMAEEYSATLNKPCIPIMNAIDMGKYVKATQQVRESNDDAELSLAYFGGLHLNRWKSLGAIGKAMESIATKSDSRIRLFIYTNQKPDQKMMKVLHNKPYIQYVGSVDASQIVSEMKKYDGLVHVESFESKMKQKTRLSISTKIPEYMASGKPIFAVGPKEVSSMRYITHQKIAYVINSLENESIETGLLKMLAEKGLHVQLGERGITLAKQNHSIEKNKKIIHRTLLEGFERKHLFR